MIINSLILLDNIDKLFINAPRKINNNNDNLSYFIGLLKENIVKFELDLNTMKRKLKFLIFRLSCNLN